MGKVSLAHQTVYQENWLLACFDKDKRSGEKKIVVLWVIRIPFLCVLDYTKAVHFRWC